MLVCATALPSHALAADKTSGSVRIETLQSSNVPGEIRVGIYTPPGYRERPPQPYPLMLLLHGGNGSEQDLLRFAATIDQAVATSRSVRRSYGSESGS